MGLAFGGSTGGTSSKASSSSAQDNVYSPDQSTVQSLFGRFAQALIPSLTAGDLAPATEAQTTANADKINRNFSGVASNLMKAYAARGFGPSGQAGDSTLQTELARQGAQAGNLEAGADSQLQQNQQSLLAALQYAFQSLGTTAAGTSTGNSSSWGFTGKAVV